MRYLIKLALFSLTLLAVALLSSWPPAVFGLFNATGKTDPPTPGIKQALIVHDQSDDPQLAQELASLLGHFPVQARVVEEANYKPRLLNAYDVVFYIGGTHREISLDFLNDIYDTDKPVVWMGRGLDRLRAEHPLTKYGFNYARVDSSEEFTSVNYQGFTLSKTNPVTNLTYITDEGLASVLAWVEGDGQRYPYVIHSHNFWYFADVPMVGIDQNSAYSAAGATEDSAYLVLADLLHDILNMPHAPRHQAMVRIEDIHPNTDIDRLNEAINYLYHKGIPFGIALVPEYVNPETGERVRLADRPQFVKTIKDAQKKGATIILHGYTHQLQGETVVDYEFWDRDTHAPPAGETEASVRLRITAALREVNDNGIFPAIWETPHYAASSMAHKVISEYFGVVWERREAPFFPYRVWSNKYSQLILPETLGYVSPEQDHPPEKLLKIAEKLKSVRDGDAVFFFHPQVGNKELREMVTGLEEKGYSFVSPAEASGLYFQQPEPPPWLEETAWRISDRVGALLPDSLVSPSLLSGLAIFIILYYWGIFLLSRRPAPSKGKVDPSLEFVIVIPALNEELVIGRTLDHLMSLPYKNLSIVVVNDNSDDRTRDIVLTYPGGRVFLLDHPAAMARQGKGRVLNFAFHSLMAGSLVATKGADKVIMGVLDADGRVDQNIINAVNPYFADPKAGAVQVGVRISNADTNTLTKWQNFEFLTFARISQKAREHLGSVGLGGNGQFARLSALASLGADPWTDCLTEDLDLGIRLMLAGWQNHYCPDSFVAQQGVPRLIPLIRQRTRWFQGHLTCWRHIPALLARRGPVIARTDTIYYLLAPMLVFLFLPSSILFVFWSIYFLATGATAVALSPWSYLPALVVWYLFSFGALPTVVWTFWREEKGMSALRAFFWAHLFSFFYVIWFIAGCKAVYRMARGEGSWAKTARTKEPGEHKVESL